MTRQNMFYWQSDRPFTQEEINSIFLQRKSTYSRDEVIKVACQVMNEEILVLEDPINQGSVNIVSPFTTISERQGVIRVHPPQVKNGYFFVEAEVMKLAQKYGIPTPNIIKVDDSRNIAPFDYMVMERVLGEVMRPVVEKEPQLHASYLNQIGEYLGKLHKI